MSSDTVSVEFEQIGAEDVIKAIEEYIASVEGMEKASNVDLSPLTDGLDTVNKSASDNISILEDLVGSVEGLEPGFSAGAAGANELNTSIGQVNTTVGEGQTTLDSYVTTLDGAATGIDTVSASASTGAGSMTELQAATTEEAAATEQLASGITPLGQLIEETTTATGGLNSALVENTSLMNESAAAAQELNTNMSELGPIFADTNTTATGAVTTFQDLVGAEGALGEAIQATAGPLGEHNTLIENLATTTPDATSAMDELASRTDELGTSVESSAGRWKTLDSAMGSTVGFMGNAASGAISLAGGFVRLEQAQNRVEKTTIRVSKAQEALQKAQNKLNALRESGTASAAELAQAENDVQQASDTLAATQEQLGIQQELLNFKMASFYAEIGPNIVQTVTGIIAGVSQMPQAFGKIATSLGITKTATDQYSVSTEGASQATADFGIDINQGGTDLSTFGNIASQTTGSITTMGGGMTNTAKAFSIGSGIFLAASAAIAVISTNAFGARDGLNQLGEALGNAVPPLEGLLVGVQNLAVDIGIAGDDAKASVEDFRSLEEQVASMGTGLEQAGAQLAEMDSRFVNTGQAVQELGSTVKTAGTEIVTETSGWGAAIDAFADAVARRDWSTAFDLVIAGFESVGVVAWDVVQIIGDAMVAAGALIMDTLNEAVLIAGNLILEGLKRAAAGLDAAIGAPIRNFFGQIGADIQAAVAKWSSDFQRNLATMVDSANTVATSIAQAFNSIGGQVHDIAATLYTNLGIESFVNTVRTQVQNLANQIATLLAGAGGGELGEPTGGGMAARQADIDKVNNSQTQLNKNTQAWINMQQYFQSANAGSSATLNEESNVMANLQSRFAGSTRTAGQLGTATADLQSRFTTASQAGRIVDGVAASLTSRFTGMVRPMADSSTAATGLTGNFASAAQIMPGFNAALQASQNTVSNLPPTFKAYGEAIQTATDAGLQIPPTVLASKEATIAYSEAVTQNTGELAKNFGAAAGYIASQGQAANAVGLTMQQTINYATALKAGKAEIDRLTTGQQAANAALLGTQQAYATMNPQVLQHVLALQQEAQQLELNNLLMEGSTQFQIALAEGKTKMIGSLVESINSLTIENQLLQDSTVQHLMMEQAVLQSEVALRKQNIELQAQAKSLSDAEQRQLMFNNAVLEIANSLKEEEIQLRAAGAAMQDHTNQLQELVNAYLEGRNSVDEFVNSLAQTRVETQGAIDRFAELGFSIGTLPKYMEPTVESLETLAQATLGSGQQVVEATTAMTDAWREAHPTMVGLLDSLTEAFAKSGKEQKEAVTKAWESLPEDVEGFLSEMDKKGIEGMARFTEDLNSGFAAFDLLDAIGKTEEGMDAFMQIFEDAKDQAPQTWGIMFDEIESIAKSGSSSMMAEMKKAIEEGGDPKVVEQKLKAIIKKHENAVDEVTRQWLRIREIDPGAIDPTAGIGERIGALKKFGAEDDRMRKEAKAKEKGMETDPFASIVQSAKTADAAVQGAIDQMVTNISAKWTTLMTTLNSSAAQYGQLIGASLGTGFATSFGVLNQTLMTTWTSMMTTLNTSAVQYGQLTGASFATGFATAFGILNQTLMATWVSMMTTLNTSAIQYGSLTGASFATGFATAIGILNTTLLTTWTTVMTTLNTSALQWGSLVGASFATGFATAIGILNTTFLTTWTTIMTTLNTSAIQYGSLIAMSLGTAFNTTLTAQFMLIMQNWIVQMTTLNTSAVQYGSLIAMSFGTAFNVGITAQFLLIMQNWVVQMTTLNTSAVQYGSLVALSFGTAFNVGLTAQFMLLMQNWVVQMTTLNTSAVQYGTLIGTSLGTGIVTGMTTAQTTIMTAWTTMMTTLVTSAVQYGGLAGTSFGTAFNGPFAAALAVALGVWTTHMSTLASSATQYGGLVATNFGSAFTPKWNQILQAATQRFAQFSQELVSEAQSMTQEMISLVQEMGDEFSNIMDQMSDRVSAFADAFASAMDQVASSADEARQAVEELQSAIDNLKDKTVTITVQYKEVGKPKGVQHGGSWIVDHPMRFDGVKMGEHHKPELVTVTPLTNPNRNTEKTIDASRFMSAPTTTSVGMQRGGRIIAPAPGGDTEGLFRSLITEVRQMRMNFRDMKIMSTTVLDSQIIDQRIQQRRALRTQNFG